MVWAYQSSMGRRPCCEKIGLKRGPWTLEEDHKLISFILNNGIHCWRLVPKLAGLLRCGKSCRLRWINYLRPDLKRGAFTDEEEDRIIELHSRLGNRWSKIATHFPGRTDNEIKNHWNTKIKKKMKLLGLDPVTHKPLDITEQTDANQKEEPDQSSTPPVNNNETTSEDKLDTLITDSDTLFEDLNNMESLFEADISSSLVSNPSSISLEESNGVNISMTTTTSDYSYLAQDSISYDHWNLDMLPWEIFATLQDNLFHF